MGREGREVWKKRVARWRDGGLPAREFAAQAGVNAHTLAWWAWRLGTGAGDTSAKPRAHAAGRKAARVDWVEVVASGATGRRARVISAEPVATAEPAPDTRLELVLGGGLVVRVPCGFDPESLERLLAVCCEAR